MPDRASQASGMSVACGESTAPVATFSPSRSAADLTFESLRTTTTEARSWSVSRMATALTARPAAAASRVARIQASGEFHAAWIRPATSSSTCIS